MTQDLTHSIQTMTLCSKLPGQGDLTHAQHVDPAWTLRPAELTFT